MPWNPANLTEEPDFEQLARAVSMVESSGNPYANSGQAQGLMQLTPPMQRAYGVTDPYDPQQSMTAGTRMLQELWGKYHNLDSTLLAYHAGEPNVNKYLAGQPSGVGPRTLAYPGKVAAALGVASAAGSAAAPTPQQMQSAQASPPQVDVTVPQPLAALNMQNSYQETAPPPEQPQEAKPEEKKPGGFTYESLRAQYLNQPTTAQPVKADPNSFTYDSLRAQYLDQPAPAPAPGMLGTIGSAAKKGLVSGVTDLSEGVANVGRMRRGEAPELGEEQPQDAVDQILATPLSEGWNSPKWWAAFLTHGATSSLPWLAGQGAGGVIGGALGSVAGPVGTAAGAFAGRTAGSMLVSGLQSLVPAYRRALEQGHQGDEAVTQAIRDSQISAGVAAFMPHTPGIGMFGKTEVANAATGELEKKLTHPIKEALVQLGVYQPSLMTGQYAATQASDQQPITPSGLATAYIEGVAQGAPFIGHHAAMEAIRARRARGDTAAGAQTGDLSTIGKEDKPLNFGGEAGEARTLGTDQSAGPLVDQTGATAGEASQAADAATGAEASKAPPVPGDRPPAATTAAVSPDTNLTVERYVDTMAAAGRPESPVRQQFLINNRQGISAEIQRRKNLEAIGKPFDDAIPEPDAAPPAAESPAVPARQPGEAASPLPAVPAGQPAGAPAAREKPAAPAESAFSGKLNRGGDDNGLSAAEIAAYHGISSAISRGDAESLQGVKLTLSGRIGGGTRFILRGEGQGGIGLGQLAEIFAERGIIEGKGDEGAAIEAIQRDLDARNSGNPEKRVYGYGEEPKDQEARVAKRNQEIARAQAVSTLLNHGIDHSKLSDEQLGRLVDTLERAEEESREDEPGRLHATKEFKPLIDQIRDHARLDAIGKRQENAQLTQDRLTTAIEELGNRVNERRRVRAQVDTEAENSRGQGQGDGGLAPGDEFSQFPRNERPVPARDAGEHQNPAGHSDDQSARPADHGRTAAGSGADIVARAESGTGPGAPTKSAEPGRRGKPDTGRAAIQGEPPRTEAVADDGDIPFRRERAGQRGEPDFKNRDTPEARQERRQAQTKLASIAREIAPGAKPVVVDHLFEGTNKVRGALLGRFIAVSMLDHAKMHRGDTAMRNILNHEIVHFLKRFGLFDDKEWASLKAAAEKQDWIRKHKIDRDYADKPHDVQLEEAIAEQYKEFAAGNAKLAPGLRRMFAKMQQLFERFGNYLKGRGFSDWRQVMERIGSGEVGARPERAGGTKDIAYHRAYHGSPHDFERFDSSKIGTGEGAQAYGHGLYFAGNKDVAEFYRNKLSKSRDHVYIDGKRVDGDELMGRYFEPGSIIPGHGNIDRVISYDPENRSVTVQSATPKDPAARTTIADMGEPSKWGNSPYSKPRTHGTMPDRSDLEMVARARGWRVGEGRLYEAELAPKEHEYLDWDKPIREQPVKIDDALHDLLLDHFTRAEVSHMLNTKSGADIYRALSQALGGERTLAKDKGGYPVSYSDDAAASRVLADAGIPGMKYLDQVSRDGGKASHNYVIFDDKHVNIEAKYSRERPEAELPLGAIDKTDQGEQRVLPGAERIPDKRLAERKMEEPLQAKRAQKSVEDTPLFGGPEKQGALFSREPQDKKEAMDAFERYHAMTEGYPASEAIQAMEDSWRGGIANLGEPKAAQWIRRVSGYFDYRSHLEEAARNSLGDTFKVYRAMTPEQLDAWRKRNPYAKDMDPVGVTLNRDLAEKWANVAANRGKERRVVEFDATPESIVMRGHEGEAELVIDPSTLDPPATDRNGKTRAEAQPTPFAREPNKDEKAADKKLNVKPTERERIEKNQALNGERIANAKQAENQIAAARAQEDTGKQLGDRFGLKRLLDWYESRAADGSRPLSDKRWDPNFFQREILHPFMVAFMDKTGNFARVHRLVKDMVARIKGHNADLYRIAKPAMELSSKVFNGELGPFLERTRLEGKNLRAEVPEKLRSAYDSLMEYGKYTVGLMRERALEAAEKPKGYSFDQLATDNKLDPASLRYATDMMNRDEGDKRMKHGQLASSYFEKLPEDVRHLAKMLALYDGIQDRPYVPFSRYGHWGIVVRRIGTDGKPTGANVHMETLEKSWRTRRQPTATDQQNASQRKAALMKEFPESEGYRVSDWFDLTNQKALQDAKITEANLDKMAAHAGIKDTDDYLRVKDALMAAGKGVGFTGHLIKASNVPGYSKDFQRAYANHMSGLSGYLGRQWARPLLDKAMAQMGVTYDERTGASTLKGGDQEQLQKYADRYIKYAMSPQEEYQRVRQLTFFYYLGGNVSSAAIQLTQVPVFTLPYLSMFTKGHGMAASRELTRAIKDVAKMFSLKHENGFYDPAKGPADIPSMAEEDRRGTFGGSAYHEAIGMGANSSLNQLPLMRALGPKMKKVANAGAQMFAMAEQFNRLVTYVAAHRLVQNEKIAETMQRVLKDDPNWREELGTLGKMDPAAVARYMVEASHFTTGKANRPEMMRHEGALLFQFKGYTLQSLELMQRLATSHGTEGKLALAGIGGMIMASAGMFGLPFMQNGAQAIEEINKWFTGQDINVTAGVREILANLTGSPAITSAIMYGLPMALDANVSSRIGFGSAVPSLNEEASVAFEMVPGRINRMREYLMRGDYRSAAVEALPSFLANPARAIQWATDGVYSAKDAKQIDASKIKPQDVALKALGFTPSNVSEARARIHDQRVADSALTEFKSATYNQIGRATAQLAAAKTDDERQSLNAELARIYQGIRDYNQGKTIERIFVPEPASIQKATRQALQGFTVGNVPARMRGMYAQGAGSYDAP